METFIRFLPLLFEGILIIAALFLVGIIAVLIGIILIYVEAGGSVSASTQFGDFSGAVGPVALILGIVLMAISVLV